MHTHTNASVACALVFLASSTLLASGDVLASGAAPPRAQRIAVYDLEATGVDPLLARVLTDAVVEELRKLDGTAIVGMSEIRAMLSHEAEKQLAGCSDDSCVSEIAEALGVDMLVVGSLARVGTDRVFALKRIDQRAAATAGTFSARVAEGDDEPLLTAVGPAVQQLFPDRPLRAGAVRGISERFAKRLHPPPLPPAVLVTSAVASGVAIAAAAVVTAPALLTTAAFEDYRADPVNLAAYDLHEHQRLGDTAQAWVIGAAAAWSVAAVATIATAVAWPLTNFGDDAATEVTP